MAFWDFLPNPGREREGLGNAGIETFKGSPLPGIARECSQNSLDAAVRNADGTSQQVHLIFRLLVVPTREVPGIEALRLTLKSCLDQAEARNQRKERDFFARAVRVAAAPTIRVLCIDDSGTTGLGRAIEGGAFDALVKSTGVTEKPDQDAMGSFGIGKNAAFAVSMLRTVFYSTLFEVDGATEFLAQGKSSLVSHESANGPKRATGYWGDVEYSPVSKASELPEWLRRSKVGTTVASVGFLEEPRWNWQVAESLIRNFFGAIRRGLVRFSVESEGSTTIEIDQENLDGLFYNADVLSAAENAGSTEELAFSSALLRLMDSPDVEELERDFRDFGRFRLRILQADTLPRRVAFIRNGMFIADNLRHFGHPLARFPMSRDFVALVEPADRQTSGRVRDMENPKHDELSAERFDDLATKNRVKATMKALGAWVREAIKNSTTKPAEGEILLQEMNQFFSKPKDGPNIADPTNLNSDPETLKLVPHTPARPRHGSGNGGDSGSAGGKKPNGGGSGVTTGGRPGRGRGTIGGRGGKTVPYSELRNVVISGSVRRITFTPETTDSARLEVTAVGIATEEPLGILSVNGIRSAQTPVLSLTSGVRSNVEVGFNQPYTGPIRVMLAPVGEEHAP